jgi:hypothetical protein
MAGASCIMLGRTNLLLLKLRAKRSGVWFKTLNRLERALINLTIKVADKVRSPRLAEALSAVTRKLEEALKSRISQIVYRIGFSLARKIGLFAKKWGNPSAENWMSDVSFARFLAIMHINCNQNALKDL